MYNSVAIEKLGKPTVTLAARGFVSDALSAASSQGMPGLRVVTESILCESTDMTDIESGIDSALEEIIAGLTRPLSAEEKSPKSKDTEKPARIIFKGSLQEVNQFFYRRGWTDGMPIIPPTEEAVAEMLTGTDLPADHLVSRIIPRLGKATVEKIAINAVMAGALPTYMPLLITAVQTVMDRQARFDIFEVSTGSWSPFWIINGPLRQQIRLNCSSGALSPGDMANATIGRAMGLIIKNIGGARKGVEDMGVLGNPAKYSLVLGEYEEESPWEPLQVERGFKNDENTLTLFCPNNFLQSIPGTTDVNGILKMLVNNIAPVHGGGLACFIINPTHAKTIAKEGWTKAKVKEYISQNATVPADRALRNRAPSESGTSALDQKNRIRIMPDLNGIMVLVAGGPGAFTGLITSVGGPGFNCSFVTHKIELPANWDRLVEKYKNMVPAYARY